MLASSVLIFSLVQEHNCDTDKQQQISMQPAVDDPDHSFEQAPPLPPASAFNTKILRQEVTKAVKATVLRELSQQGLPPVANVGLSSRTVCLQDALRSLPGIPELFLAFSQLIRLQT